jgi:hypothetical protein
MRMWMVNPKLLCRQHLLGEHQETHSFVGCIRKGTSLKGYIENGLIEVHNLKKRHQQLAKEMIERGYNHKSPLPEFKDYECGRIDREENINELRKRCSECQKRIMILSNI